MSTAAQAPDTRPVAGTHESQLIVLQAGSEQQRYYWRTREIAWSWARVVGFVGFFATWLAAPESLVLFGCSLALCVVLFLTALRKHASARLHRVLADNRCLVVGESLRRVGGQLEVIRSCDRPLPAAGPALPPAIQDGPTWPLTDQERDDLDLFDAPLGLFGLLNRTSTTLGSRRLDFMLNRPCLCADRIAARQETVRWLAEHLPHRAELMSAAASLRACDHALDDLVRSVEQARVLMLKVPVRLLRVWGLVSGVMITVGVVSLFRGSDNYSFAALLAVNMVVLAAIRSKVSPAVLTWQSVAAAVEACLALARVGVNHLPGETDLRLLRDRFAGALQPAVLPRLVGTLGWLNIGGAAQLVVNLLFLYELHLADSILRRVVTHRERLREMFAAVAELDALASLAAFAFEQPSVCYPALASGDGLRIDDGLHPLIAPGEALPNSVELTAPVRTWIITGSNMAGKSTFLRMVGTSVLLAQMGTAVCARAMSLAPLRLITDLRARDNLSRHESYYLAEVRQLRRLLEPGSNGPPVLGLIDEPFRGTNSEEQAAASIAVVQSLIESPHFFLVATHERRLVRLGDGVAALNYHFRETLEDSGMVFDYRLRPGPAQTRNAIRTLQRENYPEQIIERAARMLERPDTDLPDA